MSTLVDYLKGKNTCFQLYNLGINNRNNIFTKFGIIVPQPQLVDASIPDPINVACQFVNQERKK